jgi:hypothetical protein
VRQPLDVIVLVLRQHDAVASHPVRHREGPLGSTAWAGQTARDHDNPLHQRRRGSADPLLLMLAFVVFFFPGAILFFPCLIVPEFV